MIYLHFKQIEDWVSLLYGLVVWVKGKETRNIKQKAIEKQAQWRFAFCVKNLYGKIYSTFSLYI